MKVEYNVLDRHIDGEDGVKPKNCLTREESNSFFIYKAFAILCVIAAHVSSIIIGAGRLAFINSSFWAMMARIGVGVFFLVSGFFFHREKRDTLIFWT